MISVGDILRNEREAQRKTVAAVAEELCITKDYLSAMESGDVASLPGTFFYKSFVKQYATLLGLEPQPLIDRIDTALESAAEEAEQPRFPAASEVQKQSGSVWRGGIRVPDPLLEAANKLDLSGRELGLPAIAGFIVVLLACSSFYAWWIERTNGGPEVDQPQTTVSELARGESDADFRVDDTAAFDFEKGSGVEVTETTGPDGARRVVLNVAATEETWISITSEGKQVFSGVLRPSESKTLSGLEGAQMRVGNAGGIEVRLNGREIGPIGKSGQVRVVEFTPDDYEIVAPAKPKRAEIQETL